MQSMRLSADSALFLSLGPHSLELLSANRCPGDPSRSSLRLKLPPKPPQASKANFETSTSSHKGGLEVRAPSLNESRLAAEYRGRRRTIRMLARALHTKPCPGPLPLQHHQLQKNVLSCHGDSGHVAVLSAGSNPTFCHTQNTARYRTAKASVPAKPSPAAPSHAAVRSTFAIGRSCFLRTCFRDSFLFVHVVLGFSEENLCSLRML